MHRQPGLLTGKAFAPMVCVALQYDVKAKVHGHFRIKGLIACEHCHLMYPFSRPIRINEKAAYSAATLRVT